jgi:cell filamentation protein
MLLPGHRIGDRFCLYNEVMKHTADNLTIKEIKQEEADACLKQMYYSGGELLENLRKAFHAEKDSDPPRALSQEKREYYMVYANQHAELLAGINSHSCDISSFAKVVPKSESKARGRDCIRKLIEEILVKSCRTKEKCFFSVATNEEGKLVFEYLRKNLPKGIKEIKTHQPNSGWYPYTLFIANRSSVNDWSQDQPLTRNKTGRRRNRMPKKLKRNRYSTMGLIEHEYEPGGKVLRNKLGIRKPVEMEHAEAEAFQKTQLHFYNLFSEDPSPPITEKLIRDIHHHWLRRIYQWAGRYRRVNLSKEEITFPPASLQDGSPNIPRLMEEFEKEVLRKYAALRKGEDFSNVAEAIAVVHGEFEIIHPFREGNGRIGRLIADLMVLQAGYPPLIFDIEGKPRNKKLYFDAMKEVFVNKNYDMLKNIIEKAMQLGIQKARG